ncbi:hypothetical protein HJG60_009443 [Phyllostomus discolor]|uniref:Uncharacterized protein n=1 Tax=Phyllostomus discolor TaxID=89673 RepID=A0A833YFZ9_9CHIR|nr:hypothetical protein HJG60_009443 [Phyllostomus discolor]
MVTPRSAAGPPAVSGAGKGSRLSLQASCFSVCTVMAGGWALRRPLWPPTALSGEGGPANLLQPGSGCRDHLGLWLRRGSLRRRFETPSASGGSAVAPPGPVLLLSSPDPEPAWGADQKKPPRSPPPPPPNSVSVESGERPPGLPRSTPSRLPPSRPRSPLGAWACCLPSPSLTLEGASLFPHGTS